MLHSFFILKALLLVVFLFSSSAERIKDISDNELIAIEKVNAGVEFREEITGDLSMKQLLQETHNYGGVIIHVGCGTGELTADLLLDENFIVQGLNDDLEDIETARKYVSGLKHNGRLSFMNWSGHSLPYTDNLINVLFWEKPSELADEEDILRVLTPNGVAYIKEEGGWRKLIKQWPDDIDEWPHFRYDAGSKGASKDKKVGPPRHIQWEAGPRFMRSHEIESGLSSIISAKGLVYYILDEGPIGISDSRFPPKWSLMCRDAFNGTLLWKLPMPEWGWQAWTEGRENNPHVWHYTRNRPADVDRIMVANDDMLYVTLSYGAPISAIEGKTGKVLMTYKETEGVKEFIFMDGILLVRKDNPSHTITAISAEDGEVLWKRDESIIMERSLSAAGNQVFFHDRWEMISLDLTTGRELWKQETKMRPSCVLAHEDVILITQSALTLALSAKTGEKLWDAPGTPHRAYYPELYIVDDIVWSGRPNFDARKIQTGEIIKKMELQKVLESGHHRRCFTERSTCNFMITGERGTEFLDLQGNDHSRNNWVRGACVTGGVPANGLYYVPPHQCFCYPAIRMDGFFALGSELSVPQSKEGNKVKQRLEKGPAFNRISKEKYNADEWPTYRHDAERSGAVTFRVNHELKKLWSANLGGNLSQAVVAGQKLFVVQKDAGTVHCLALESGELLWSRTVAGRIDSPPSVFNGAVFFGSHDGYVYSLRASDGELAWRFLAAPGERQIISYDQLESAWPAHGSVLIKDGLVYCSAGRSAFLDGGIYLYALDAENGKPIHQTILEENDSDISQRTYAFHHEGHRSDLLTTDGRYLYMGRTMFNSALEEVETERITMIGTVRGDTLEYRKMPEMRLVATGGFLNQTFWNRTFWMHSYVWPGFQFAQQAPKSGQMLVFNDQFTYSVKFFTNRNFNSPMLFPGNGYLLFADDIDNEPLLYRGEGEPSPIEWEPVLKADEKFTSSKPFWTIYQDAAADKGTGFTRAKPARWTSWVDVRIEAMVLAGDQLFIAGTPDIVPEDDPLAALEGRMGGVLKVVSAGDGSESAQYSLDSNPVFDGLIAAQGKLLLCNKKGEVICMGHK